MPRKRIRTTSLREDDDILECLRTFLAKDNLPFTKLKLEFNWKNKLDVCVKGIILNLNILK